MNVVDFKERLNTRGPLNPDEIETFTQLLDALDEAECRPRVRAALVDVLGYDPCENPYGKELA